ncbi:MAG TPA: putative Se/S carrier-like protein [Clostridium sp.]|uniref:putative Se/S carrier-like protein n=1 Tax=Clostridium sp. TaxID=1506 RepID=UPI002F92D356
MKAEENEYLVVYPGHNAATLLYQRLLNKSCNIELVSTPIIISYGCSQSIKFKEVYMNIVRDEIRKINIKPKGIYLIVKKGRYDNYEKV